MSFLFVQVYKRICKTIQRNYNKQNKKDYKKLIQNDNKRKRQKYTSTNKQRTTYSIERLFD